MNNFKHEDILTFPEGNTILNIDDRFWVSRIKNDNIAFVIDFSTTNIEDKNSKLFEEIEPLVYRTKDDNLLLYKLTMKDEDREKMFLSISREVALKVSKLPTAFLQEAIIRELILWSQVLSPTREGVSHESYIGIWAELYAVRKYLLPRFSPDDIISLYKGPLGAPQDISCDAFSIEIKCSSKESLSSIQISSFEQLDSSSLKQSLYLVHIEEGGSGLSLDQLVREIESYLSISDSALMTFKKTIASIFSKVSESQLYQTNSVIDEFCWRISDNFPAIKRRNLPEGVKKGTYSILVNLLKDFYIEDGLQGFLNE